MKSVGRLAFTGFVLTVLAANWAIERFGVVSVGFGLVAPAGVYFAGLAFTFRDVLHETLGRRWVLGAIVLGAVLSWYISDAVTLPGGYVALAVASALAFAFSELCDYAVYAPLRTRGWLRAVALSGLVGAVVDSMLFLWLAFGSLEFLAGQVVGKLWIVGGMVALLWLARKGRTWNVSRA